MENSGRTEELLVRAVTALEKIADDPVLQIESGPAVCPFCQTINPPVKVDDDSGEGPFSMFVTEPQCLVCENKFYALPLQWATFTSHEELSDELVRRADEYSNVQHK